MAVNRKKILLPTEMARAGWSVLDGRDDLEPVAFGPELSTEAFHELLATAAGVALWGRPFPAAAVAASASSAPANWAATKPGRPAGAIPENVSVKLRAMATAGLANEVEAVNQ